MEEIVYTHARQNLKEVIDGVVESGNPIKILRRDHSGSVVVVKENIYQDLVNHKEGGQGGKKKSKR